MDYAQIIRKDTDEPVDIANAAGEPYIVDNPNNPFVTKNELPEAPTTPTHETKVIDLETLDIEGVSGTLSYIIVQLTPQVSDVSIWGEVLTDETVTANSFNILSTVVEPLFARFIGVVEKVALNVHADGTLAMLPYRYDENGLTINIQTTDPQQVTFQDRLFLVGDEAAQEDGEQ